MYSVNGPPTIIDIEASGFGPDGYPVEIGVALPSGDTYCALIRPCPEWNYWDEEAEKVHRVPRDILELYGRSIDDITADLNGLMTGQTVQCFWSCAESVFNLHGCHRNLHPCISGEG